MPPFMIILIKDVASGACCTGSAGEEEMILLRVSKELIVSISIGVILISYCIKIYFSGYKRNKSIYKYNLVPEKIKFTLI